MLDKIIDTKDKLITQAKFKSHHIIHFAIVTFVTTPFHHIIINKDTKTLKHHTIVLYEYI